MKYYPLLVTNMRIILCNKINFRAIFLLQWVETYNSGDFAVLGYGLNKMAAPH